MKVVIIEDEALTAQDMAEILLGLPGNIEVVKILSSVSEAIEYFRHHEYPELIFCDIQLGDGNSFEIFRSLQIDVPVVFCTAYSHYAIEAFKSNGIYYLLKPFSIQSISEAIDRYKNFKARLGHAALNYENILRAIARAGASSPKVSSLLINWKDRIVPVRIADIALFCIEYKMPQLVTFDNQKHFVNQTLEELEEICGDKFYRANRQYLINRDCVAEAVQYYARKLVVKLRIEGRYEIIISKRRIPEFLSWLRG
jgi:two-component system, LytTR family, response regulator LytT